MVHQELRAPATCRYISVVKIIIGQFGNVRSELQPPLASLGSSSQGYPRAPAPSRDWIVENQSSRVVMCFFSFSVSKTSKYGFG